MILNPVGGSAVGRLVPATALRLGMAAFMVALVGVVVSLRASAPVPFIAASLVVGAALGLATTAGLRALLAAAKADERAGLLATIYLVGYSGGALPGIVAGRLASRFDLLSLAVGYAVLGAVAAIVAMIFAGQRSNVPSESTTTSASI